MPENVIFLLLLLLFPPMHQYSPTPVHRLWHGHLVEIFFNEALSGRHRSFYVQNFNIILVARLP